MYAVEVRKQLTELCERTNIPIKSCAPQTEPVRRCLLAGLLLSVAEYQREGHYLTVYFKKWVLLMAFDKFLYFNCLLLCDTVGFETDCVDSPVVGSLSLEASVHRLH